MSHRNAIKLLTNLIAKRVLKVGQDKSIKLSDCEGRLWSFNSDNQLRMLVTIEQLEIVTVEDCILMEDELQGMAIVYVLDGSDYLIFLLDYSDRVGNF